jgi:haloacid dehalogenase-like hydrolase
MPSLRDWKSAICVTAVNKNGLRPHFYLLPFAFLLFSFYLSLMPIRLLALDLDGTLLNSRGVLTERNCRAIAEARRLGVRVALVTGRRFRGDSCHAPAAA